MVKDERSLVFKLEKILKKEFGTNLAFHEFTTGYGIADLVFAKKFSFSRKILKRKPITDFNSFSLFLNLDINKEYSISEISNIFPYLNESEIKKRLRVLVTSGYLNKLDKNFYKKNISEINFNPIKKIIAIEVKLNDHKNGLIQARRYKYFADESYLAILKEAEKNIDISEFNKQNIGLILFNSKDNTIEIKHPREDQRIEKKINLFAKELMVYKFNNVAF